MAVLKDIFKPIHSSYIKESFEKSISSLKILEFFEIFFKNSLFKLSFELMASNDSYRRKFYGFTALKLKQRRF